MGEECARLLCWRRGKCKFPFFLEGKASSELFPSVCLLNYAFNIRSEMGLAHVALLLFADCLFFPIYLLKIPKLLNANHFQAGFVPSIIHFCDLS